VAHVYTSRQTLNGREGVVTVPAKPGQRARVRVVNTDNGPLETWSNTPYRLVSLDGTDLHGPTKVTGKALTVTAGGRADLEFEVPEGGEPVRVQVGSATALVIGAEGATAAKPPQPKEKLDLLAYGTPAPVGFDPSKPARRFDYSIGRRPGFLDGKPGFWWSVNGHLFPDLPMYVVNEGDVVMVRLENHSGEVHPMHLHGHHAIVVRRDGKPVTGSPWWFDSLNVRDGETFDIAFVADNPGMWMDHCHNLEHAADGLVTHLMYEGVTEPFRVGGPAGNEPE
jgi:FtsP/CotA-like multicopper oxidase with cupredoxin domain